MRTLFFSLIMLTGCAHIYTTEVAGPDGKPVLEAHCNGNRNTFGDCMNEAARNCDSTGYEIMDKNQSTIGIGEGDTVSKRQLLFRCKGERRLAE